jgi:hypothetical protein
VKAEEERDEAAGITSARAPQATPQAVAEGANLSAQQGISAELFARETSEIMEFHNTGVRMRDTGDLDGALAVFDQSLAQIEDLHGRNSPCVASVLKSMVIAKFKAGDCGALVDLASRATAILLNALERDEKNSHWNEQLAMICDYEMQALVKMERPADAYESASTAIAAMERAGLGSHSKIMEFRMSQEMCRLCLVGCTETRQMGPKPEQTGSLRAPLPTSQGAVVHFDVLAGHFLAAFQKGDPKPHGCIHSAEAEKPALDYLDECVRATYRDGGAELGLAKVLHVGRGGVTSFEDFRLGNQTSAPLSHQRSWYSRMKLRYSCSSLAVTFTKALVPHLRKGGVSSIELPDGKLLELHTDDLEILAVYFKPTQRHVLEFPQSLLGQQQEMIEAPDPQMIEGPSDGACSHNILLSKKSGTIIDLSIGQFTGEMFPKAHSSWEEFERCLPGAICHKHVCSSEDIEGQYSRDVASVQFRKKSSIHPEVLAQQTVSAIQSSGSHWAGMCRLCFGVPSASVLMKCSRCKAVFYCGTACQKDDWRRHKKEECK